MRLKAKTKDVYILSVFVVGHIGSAYHRVRITASLPMFTMFYNSKLYILCVEIIISLTDKKFNKNNSKYLMKKLS